MKKYILLWISIIAFSSANASNFDFELTQFECSETNVNPGQMVTIAVNHVLTGDSIPLVSPILNLYISTDTVLDQQDISFLENSDQHCFRFYHFMDGNSIYKEQTFTIPHLYDMSIEDYFVIASIDDENYAEETNESNNRYYLPIKITGTNNNDFFIKNVSVDSIKLNPRQEFRFSFDHCYQGDSEFPFAPIFNLMYSRDQIWGNEIDDDTIHINPWSISSLSKLMPVQNINTRLNLKTGLQGEYYLLIKTDWNDCFKEADETNNVESIKIVIDKEVNDFIVTDVTSTYNEIQSGQKFPISCTINYDGNIGSLLTPKIVYFLSKDTLIDASDRNICITDWCGRANLSSSHNTYTNHINLEIPIEIDAGDYFILAKVETPESIIETDTTNNNNYHSIKVTGPPTHDFYLSGPTLSSANVYSGATININCNLNYEGDSWSSLSCDFEIYFSIDKTWDINDQKIDKTPYNNTVSYFNVNNTIRSFNRQVTIPQNLQTGEYYIIIKADPENAIDEFNEDNNTRWKKINVEAIVQDFAISWMEMESDSVYPDGLIHCTSKLKHQSTSPDEAMVKINLYLSKDTILHNDEFDSLAIYVSQMYFYSWEREQNGNHSISLTGDIPPGEYYVILSLDDGNQIEETDESNNLAYDKIVIKDAPIHDFGIENIVLSHDTIKPQEYLSISFDQVYYGNSTEEINSQYEVYFSEDTLINNAMCMCCYGCSSYGYSINNRRVECSRGISIPEQTAPGTYYVIIDIDYGNQYNETNETNNRVIIPIEVEELYFDYYIDSLVLKRQQVPREDYLEVDAFCAYQGNLASNNSISVQFRLSKNDVWGDSDDRSLSESWEHPNVYLGAYANTNKLNYKALIPQFIVPGDYYLLAYINLQNQDQETNQSNNVIAQPIEITSQASRDFYISNVSISDTIVHTNASVTIQYTHHYEGNSSVYLTSAIGLYISSDTILDDTDKIITDENQAFDYTGGDMSNPISKNSETIVLPNWLTNGSQYLILITDYNNKHNEFNEDNNTNFIKVDIIEETIDLSVNSFKIARDTVQMGGEIESSCNVYLTGNTLNKISFNTQLYVSNDSIFSKNDAKIGNSRHYHLRRENNKASISLKTNVPPGAKTGDQYLFVKVDYDNKNAETNEDNNIGYCPITIAPEPTHDFYICDAELKDSTLVQQSSTQLSFTYCYGGNSFKNVTSRMKLYLSKNSVLETDTDINLNRDPCFSLNVDNPRKNHYFNFQIPAQTEPGEYYLLLCADGNSEFEETNESNNCYPIKINVEELYYDFSITNINLIPDSLQKGGGINVNYQILNHSNSENQTNIKSAIYISSDSICSYDDTQLAYNYYYISEQDDISDVINQHITLPDYYNTGNYYILIKADADNGIDESNENNNLGSHLLKVVPEATRDFFIDNVEVQTSEIQPGTSLNINITHNYNGNSNDYLRSYIQVYLSKDDEWGNTDDININTSIYFDHNSQNTTHTNNFHLDVPEYVEPGIYNLLIKTDYNDTHTETNETNNMASLVIEIDEIKSDFTIKDFSISHDSVQIQGFLTTSYNLNYQGNSINSYWVYPGIVLSLDTIWGNSDDRELPTGYMSSSSLNRKNTFKTYTHTITFNTNFEAGNYYLLIKADSKDYVEETNETNNIYIKPITIRPKAEHDFYLSDLSIQPDTLQARLNVPFSVIPNYNGNSISDVEVQISFIISKDSILGNADDSNAYNYSNSGFYLNRKNTKNIEKGEFSFGTEDHVGENYLFAIIDWENKIQETNENNNAIKVPVYIEEFTNDLFVANITVASEQVQQEGLLNISYEVNYHGNSKSFIESKTQLLLSRDTIWDERTDIAICRYDCKTYQFSAQQSTFKNTTSFKNTQQLELGTYYVLVKVIPTLQLNEVNSSNNFAYKKIEIIEKATRDFSISDITVYKTPIYQNSTINVSYKCNYHGNSIDLLNVKNKLVLSKNTEWGDSDDIEFSGSQTSMINKDITTATCVSRRTLPHGLKPGIYNLIVNADFINEHEENNEENNIAIFPIEIRDKELDVFIEHLSVDADTIYTGSTVNVSSYFGHSSINASSDHLTCKYYISKNKFLDTANDSLLKEQHINLHSPVEYQKEQITIPTHIKPGMYYVFGQLEPVYSYTEKNLNNNIEKAQVTISNQGFNDFSVENMKVTPPSLHMGSSTTFDIQFDIKYEGNSQSTLNCYNKTYITNNLDNEFYSPSTSKTIKLNKDSSLFHVSQTINYNHLYEQDKLYIVIKTDYSNEYTETDEANNIAYQELELLDYPAVDFSVESMELNMDSTCVNSNFDCNIEIGYPHDMDFSVKVYTHVILSTDSIPNNGNDRYISSYMTQIDPNANKNPISVKHSNIFLNDITKAGNYYVFASVEPYFIEDSIRNNNHLTTPFKIVKQPLDDFIISNLQLETDTINLDSKASIKFKIESKNGIYTFDGLSIRTHLSTDTIWGNNNDIDCWLSSRGSSNLTNNAQISHNTLTISSETPPGDYYLLVKLDAKDIINETNEDNNLTYRKVTIVEPAVNDFYITKLQVQPNIITNEDTIRISGKMNNKENSKNFVFPDVSFYISANNLFGDVDDLHQLYVPTYLITIDSLTGEFLFNTHNFGLYLPKGENHLLSVIKNGASNDVNYTNNVAVAPFSIKCNPSEVHQFINLCEGETFDNWDKTGDYTEEFISTKGCDSIVYTHILEYKSPMAPTIVVDRTNLTSSSVAGNQWYYNKAPIDEATDYMYTVKKEGNYAVMFTDEYGCQSELSDYIYINYSSIKHLKADMIIYPNPTNGEIYVTQLPENKPIEVSIMDINGRQIIKQNISDSNKKIDITNQPSGIYFIKFANNSNSIKIVKQ